MISYKSKVALIKIRQFNSCKIYCVCSIAHIKITLVFYKIKEKFGTYENDGDFLKCHYHFDMYQTLIAAKLTRMMLFCSQFEVQMTANGKMQL